MAAFLRFAAITFAVTWIFFVAAVALPAGTAGSGLRGALVFVGTMMPGVVALLLTASAEGMDGVRGLLRRVVQWETGVRWYVFALGFMAAIKVGVAVMMRLTSGTWPEFDHLPVGAVVVAILFSTPFQAGEEIGWRGYGLPMLAERMGLGLASVLIGVVWACWHLPLFFLKVPGNSEYGQPFAIWTVGVTGLSVAFAWLYARAGGSLLLVMLMHAAVNNVPHFGSAVVGDAGGVFSLRGSAAAVWTAVLLWVVAGWLLVRMRNGAAGCGTARVPGR